MKRRTHEKQPRLRLDPHHVWPLRGLGAPGDEDRSAVSDALAQDMLAWSGSWHEHTDGDGAFDDEAAQAEHVSRGRGLRERLQRELDEPVAFREH